MQTFGHALGPQWTLNELKRVAGTITPEKRSENGVKSYPQLDCVELERYIFPVLHVTLGLANRLLKDTVDYADLVVEKTPQVLKTARILKILKRISRLYTIFITAYRRNTGQSAEPQRTWQGTYQPGAKLVESGLAANKRAIRCTTN